MYDPDPGETKKDLERSSFHLVGLEPHDLSSPPSLLPLSPFYSSPRSMLLDPVGSGRIFPKRP